jgi:hypothetical protein
MRNCRITLIFVSVVLVWTVARATAQDAQTTQQFDDAAQPLHYEDESAPKNNLVVDLNGATAYDDNVFGDNANRVGGTLIHAGAHFGLNEERERSALSIDYVPEFLFYTNVNGYNQVNQSLRFGAKYALSPHFELRFKDSGNYFTGIASPSLNENLAPESGPPPSLNNTVIYPLSRELSNEGRVDAVYQMSRRSGFDFYGSAGTRNFSGINNPQESLLNTQVFSGGLDYTYRVSRATTLGVSAMHQNLRYGDSLDKIESAFLTIAWEGRSGVTASLYGGPQYVRLNDDLAYLNVLPGNPFSPPIRDRGAKWEVGGGGSLGWRSARTAVQVSAQRLTSDGGGFFTSVMNSSANFDVRRNLSRRWDLLVTGTVAQSKALSPLFGGAGLNDQTGGLKIERQLANNLVAQVGYEAARQRVDGTFPFLVDMDRNYLSLGLFFRMGQIPVGRR